MSRPLLTLDRFNGERARLGRWSSRKGWKLPNLRRVRYEATVWNPARLKWDVRQTGAAPWILR
jgi:hypothetical protein